MTVFHFLTRKKQNIARRIKKYVRRDQDGEANGQQVKADRERRRGPVILGRFLSEAYRSSMKEELAMANVLLRVEEFFFIQAVCALLPALLLSLITGNIIIPVLSALLGFYSPIIILHKRQKDRLRQLDEQLPNALSLMSNSLKAGYGFTQAMETVMRDATPPISDEFRRAIQEMSLGATVEEALRGMSERIGSKDIELMITAILIQLQVGGNLAELLDGIAATIQERVRIRGQIRIVTAQGRLTGVIVGLLPFALAFIMSIFKPDYLKVLIINPVGRMMLLVGLLAQLVGVFLVRKIVNMEV